MFLCAFSSTLCAIIIIITAVLLLILLLVCVFSLFVFVFCFGVCVCVGVGCCFVVCIKSSIPHPSFSSVNFFKQILL